MCKLELVVALSFGIVALGSCGATEPESSGASSAPTIPETKPSCGKTAFHCRYDRDCCSSRCDAATMCE